jgi:hypothetical protein
MSVSVWEQHIFYADYIMLEKLLSVWELHLFGRNSDWPTVVTWFWLWLWYESFLVWRRAKIPLPFPCMSHEATEREHSARGYSWPSLRWDSKVWLWVLSYPDRILTAMQTTDPSYCQRGCGYGSWATQTEYWLQFKLQTRPIVREGSSL